MSFLVVTPLGLPHATALRDMLAAAGIRIAGGEEIGPWSAASTWLYARPERPGGVALAMRFEARWRELCPRDVAERWHLADPDDHHHMVAAKADLRLRFAGIPLDGGPPGGGTPFALHVFHVPDAADIAVESRRLDAFVLTGTPAMR